MNLKLMKLHKCIRMYTTLGYDVVYKDDAVVAILMKDGTMINSVVLMKEA